CWHNRADEAADTVGLPLEPGTSPPVWIKWGTRRPADPSARADDLLPGFIVERYRNPFAQAPFDDFATIWQGLAFDMDHPRTPGRFATDSFKWRGVLKSEVDRQCSFDMSVKGEILIKLDERVVTRKGFAGAATVQEIVNLK